jgi:hypothetical protein
VRKELAPLFGRLFRLAMLLDPSWEMRKRDETHGGQGGMACRAIKGSDPKVPSNHSSGTAWDCNTKGNPMILDDAGVPVSQKRFVSRQSPVLIRLAGAARIYWGGWYADRQSGYSDAMHFEYMARPEDVAQSLKDLDAEYERIHAELFPPEEPPVDAEQVKAVQQAINDLGWQPPLLVDGIYGPITTAAVQAVADRVATEKAQLQAVLHASEDKRKLMGGKATSVKTAAAEIEALGQ